MQVLSQDDLNRLEQKHLSNDSLDNKKTFFENYFRGNRWVLMKSLPVEQAVRWQDYFSYRFFESYTSYLNEIQTKRLIVYLEDDKLNKKFEMRFFYNLNFYDGKYIKILRTISLRKVIEFIDSQQNSYNFLFHLFYNQLHLFSYQVDQEYATKFVEYVNDNHTEEPEVRRVICNYEVTSDIYFDSVPNMEISKVFDFFKSVGYKSFENFPKNRIIDLLDFIKDKDEIENKSEIFPNLAKRFYYNEELLFGLKSSQFIFICEYISDEVMKTRDLNKFFDFIIKNGNSEEQKEFHKKFVIKLNKNKLFKNLSRDKIIYLLNFMEYENLTENEKEILRNLADKFYYDKEFLFELKPSKFILMREYISDEVMAGIDLNKFLDSIFQRSTLDEQKEIYKDFIMRFHKNKLLLYNLAPKQILNFLTFCAKEHLEKDSALFFCMDKNKFKVFLNYIFENDINELQEIIFKNLIIKFNNEARFIENLKPEQILKLIAFCLKNPHESENENFLNSYKNHLNIKHFLKFTAKNVSEIDENVLKSLPEIINFLTPEKTLDLYELWGINIFDTNFKKFYELARYTLENKKEFKSLLVKILLQTPSLIKDKDFDFEIFCQLILTDSGGINEELAARIKEYVPEFKLNANYSFDNIPKNCELVLSYFIDDFNIESIYGFNEKLFFMEFYFNCHKDNWDENNEQKFECMWQNLFEEAPYYTLKLFFKSDTISQDDFEKCLSKNNNTKIFIQSNKEKIKKFKISTHNQLSLIVFAWEIGENNEINDVIADILVNSFDWVYVAKWMLSYIKESGYFLNYEEKNKKKSRDMLRNRKIFQRMFEKYGIDLLYKLPPEAIFAMSENISYENFKQFFRNKRLDPMGCIDTNLKANEALLAKIIFAIDFKNYGYRSISECYKKFTNLLNNSNAKKEGKIFLLISFYKKLKETSEKDAAIFLLYLFCPISKLNDISKIDFVEIYQTSISPKESIDTSKDEENFTASKNFFDFDFENYEHINECYSEFEDLLNTSNATKEEKILILRSFYEKLVKNFEEDAKNFWIYLFCPTPKLDDISITDFKEAYQLRNNYLSAIKKSNIINTIILVASCLAVLAAVPLFAVFGLGLLSAAISLSIAIPLILFGVIFIPISSRFVDKNNIERLSLTHPDERPKWAILYKYRNLNIPNISHENTRAR